MPPLPKDPRTRRRRNKTVTHRQFADDGSARPKKTPVLPRTRTWQAPTVSWWKDLWTSPMRDEYLKVDVHGLYRLAVLIDRFWLGDTDVASEIRLQSQLFGLSPIDRRRLQWEVVRAEEAEDRHARRRTPREPVDDPRSVLTALDGGSPMPATRKRRVRGA